MESSTKTEQKGFKRAALRAGVLHGTSGVMPAQLPGGVPGMAGMPRGSCSYAGFRSHCGLSGYGRETGKYGKDVMNLTSKYSVKLRRKAQVFLKKAFTKSNYLRDANYTNQSLSHTINRTVS